jgi:hypothetical protein
MRAPRFGMVLVAVGLASGAGSAASAPPIAPAGAETAAESPAGGATGVAGAATVAAVVRPLALDAAAMRKLLASVPALAPFSAQFVPFTDADTDAALRRGDRSRSGISVWTFQPAAFAWTPNTGRELWVLSGRSDNRVLIAVLERRGERDFAHAASLVLQEPEATVAIGASEQYRDQLVWSTCYGCAGEGGTIRSRGDGRIEFAYR